MPYRIRYTVNVDFVGAGQGAMDALNPTGGNLPGGGVAGQTVGIVATSPLGGGIVQGGSGAAPGQIVSGDITTLVSAMTTDVTTQLNAQLAKMQGWVTGNP